ncbi:MAG: alpha/beta hydrolase [Acidobacteriota bacterium]
MRDLLVNRRRLEYELHDPVVAGAPLVVFLHEGLGCLEAWRDFPARVAAATGCGTLVYSRWGHGGSEARPGAWPVSFMHDEAQSSLPDLLGHLGIERPVLFGHSDGASIALLHAAQYPDAVRAVISVAAHVMVEAETVESIRAARARFEEGSLRQGLERYHGPNTATMFDGWSGVWLHPAFRGWDIRPELGRVRCPVLAIQGSADHYGTPVQLDAIRDGVAGPVVTSLLRGCGHSPHRDAPDAVIKAVSTLVARLE